MSSVIFNFLHRSRAFKQCCQICPPNASTILMFLLFSYVYINFEINTYRLYAFSFLHLLLPHSGRYFSVPRQPVFKFRFPSPTLTYECEYSNNVRSSYLINKRETYYNRGAIRILPSYKIYVYRYVCMYISKRENFYLFGNLANRPYNYTYRHLPHHSRVFKLSRFSLWRQMCSRLGRPLIKFQLTLNENSKSWNLRVTILEILERGANEGVLFQLKS